MGSPPWPGAAIREVNYVLYLSVWPRDGRHHDPGCEFYRDGDESEVAGPTGLLFATKSDGSAGRPRASPVRLNPDGTWAVALDVPGPKGDRLEWVHSLATQGLQSAGDAEGVSPVLGETPSLPQFLTWLWDNTSLTRWGKGWRRDWWRVAQSIRTEAQAVVIEGCRLNDHLYIPPPFVKEHKAEFHAGWDSFVSPLMATAGLRGAQQRGFVLLEDKAINRTDYGFKIL